MRNWNLANAIILRAVLDCFQRTYEELKLDCNIAQPTAITSFQRTYEELKPFSATIKVSGKPSFQRTYEELKLHSLLSTTTRIRRFQRTYEELKPFNMDIRRTFHKGFQRTYEELKQKIDSLLDAIEKVFSVPMRNWNPSSKSGHLSQIMFSAYLWGIETYTQTQLAHLNLLVFSVPMRNWNPL